MKIVFISHIIIINTSFSMVYKMKTTYNEEKRTLSWLIKLDISSFV